MEKRKIILDCDPGYDDAIAIIAAAKADNIELLGITTVKGNTTLENTSRNALNVVGYLGLDIPVYVGQDRSIVKPRGPSGLVHGKTGMDGIEFPKYDKQFAPQKAVNFIIDTCLKYPKDITIVTTGPVTNLALAIRLEPKIIDCISEVIAMGGSCGRGNVTPAAEFNFYDDPEAAYILFTSGLKIKMIGLDITLRTSLYDSVIERMEKLNNKASKMFSVYCRNYNINRVKLFGANPYGPLHDPVTIAYLINPKVVTFKEMYVTVDISGGESYGRTNCNESINKPGVNAEVGVDIDVEEYWNVLEKEIAKY